MRGFSEGDRGILYVEEGTLFNADGFEVDEEGYVLSDDDCHIPRMENTNMPVIDIIGIGSTLSQRADQISESSDDLNLANVAATLIGLFKNISDNYRKRYNLSSKDIFDLEQKLSREKQATLEILVDSYDDSKTDSKLAIIRVLCTEYLHTTDDDFDFGAYLKAGRYIQKREEREAA